MDYFVSIENKMSDHWQIELLIESFKYHNKNDDLLVAVAENKSPSNKNFIHNIQSHKRVVHHENLGEQRGYSKLNELYSLRKSIQDFLNPPFVVLKPHMVMFQDLKIEFKTKEYPEIIVSPDLSFTFEYAKKNFKDFWKCFNLEEEKIKEKWIPPGNLYAINNIDSLFFSRLIEICETLVLNQYLNSDSVWEETDKLAWSIFLAEFSDKFLIHGNHFITQTMIDFTTNPIIDYNRGMPPSFNRKMFSYNPPEFHSMGDPFEVLSKLQPNLGTKFMSDLAAINLQKRI
jgi:hypothetical protein